MQKHIKKINSIKKFKEVIFKVGDKVWYSAHDRVSKFDDLYLGPFLIIEKLGENVFLILRERSDGIKDMKTVHSQQIKLYNAEVNFDCDDDEINIDGLFKYGISEDT